MHRFPLEQFAAGLAAGEVVGRLRDGLARNGWNQMPAAVQVAAATRVKFTDDTFAHLGQVGLGIGLDANANGAGIGLGVTETTVHHNLFTDLGGAGVVVGGVQPDAHHPSNPAMTLRDITIDNNFVTDVAKDYKEMSGILSTYVDHAVITHNEVSNKVSGTAWPEDAQLVIEQAGIEPHLRTFPGVSQ
ncbi:hypothetical protein ACQP2K_18735 [Microbispora siamensis]